MLSTKPHSWFKANPHQPRKAFNDEAKTDRPSLPATPGSLADQYNRQAIEGMTPEVFLYPYGF